MATSDVSEILRRGFALKKMEELEKERESEKKSQQTEEKTSKDAPKKESPKRYDNLPSDQSKHDEQMVGEEHKCDSVKKSDKNTIPKAGKDECESKTNNISEKNIVSKSVIQIKIATKELASTSSDKDQKESNSDSSSSDSDDDDDSDDSDDEEGEGKKDKKEGAKLPWRDLLEDGEISDTSEEGKVKDGLKKEKETEKKDKEKEAKKDKKKHKKHKKKSKKKKHKHSKDKHKDKENSDKEKSKDKKESSEERTKRKHSRKSKSRSRSRSRSRSKKHKSSHSQSQSESSDRSRGHSSRSHHRHRSKSRSRSRSRDRYRYTDSRYTGSRYRSHRSEVRRYRSRSPPKREKTPLMEYDKTKLLEIARANAYAQQQAGLLPANVQLPEISREELASVKAGGKTISELTEVCKQISEKQLVVHSSDEEPVNRPIASDEEDSQQPFLHHPFQIKSQALPIVVNIKNAVQKTLPMQIQQDKETLLAQFPVSSGTQHRKKECEYVDPYGQWVVVEKKEPTTTTKPPPAPPPQQQQQQTPPSATIKETNQTETATTSASQTTEPSTEITKDEVFPKTAVSPSFDISTMVSERLQAMRKLQQNPNDVEAIGLMYKANQQIQSWASSNQKPGQFTGSTDAQILRPNELANSNPKAQAWAKKDMFHNVAPVRGGMGMYLLQKMGWKQGEGLGKNNEGSVFPLSLDVKTDRRGLVALGETQKKKASVPTPIIRDLSGKHPVSALMEICNKRKWSPPEFNIVHDSGPDHKKHFVFKVKVNNEEYQPSIASPNKKHAKAQAATVALQKMGLIPMDYVIPV